ncbi:MAG: exodeoxyribonuclease VII small subunit [Hyphomicrobiales bacterium]|nr:exodeoxyribonuclease VII small subunit [Hyphomicrobiales bacterium]
MAARKSDKAETAGSQGSDIPPDVAALGFEEALAELESIVRRLEEGSGRLDEAIAAYERGAALKKHCEAKLQEAQGRVERIVLGSGGPSGLADAGLD